MNTSKVLLNNNWRFHLDPKDNEQYAESWYKGYDDSGEDWQSVTLPHDWAVSQPFSLEHSSGTGYLCGGVGWYRLRFSIPEEFRGKKLTLCFDGVYKNSQVWFNSYHLGKRPYGYIPFSFDITDFACFGEEENVVSVKVTHTDIADSRWFTGSGINRKVTLLAEEPVHPAQNGIFFRTEAADAAAANVQISHELINETTEAAVVAVTTTLTDADGCQALKLCGQVCLEPGEQQTVSLTGCVSEPKLWSTEAPNLYTLQTSLAVGGGEAYQVFEGKVGIRTFLFDADKGFFLNGQNMKIKGVCVHHDGGCLGSAMAKEVWERRLYVLKEAGCNAIRTSHNPHMPELYDLCDEMGFLMMDEAFDEWENPKNKWSTGHNVYPPKHQGYAEDFPEWHERDLAAMVLRDRNHPSIIMWSIGNEIDYPNDPYVHPLFQQMTGNNDANKPSAERIYNPNKPNMERLAPLAKKLAAIVRRYDTTRPVTLAAAFPELSSRLHFFDALDMVGYNYKEQFYAEDHERFPGLPFIGSENGHHLAAWKAVADNDYISGQFLWTGIDFLGEAHGWPIHGSMAGMITMAGYPKSRFYRRQAFWTRNPMAALYTRPYNDNDSDWLPSSPVWNYTTGEKILVCCSTNLPHAELFLNGQSLGVRDGWDESGNMTWLVDYADGELSVKAFSTEEDGPAITGEASVPAARGEACSSLYTLGAPTELKMTHWVSPRSASAVCAGTIEQLELWLQDAEGRLSAHKALPVTVTVSGDGVLLGLENGNLADNTSYTETFRDTYEGRLLAFVRRTGCGPITVNAVCGELTAELTI